jgi:hypothetical protein
MSEFKFDDSGFKELEKRLEKSKEKLMVRFLC